MITIRKLTDGLTTVDKCLPTINLSSDKVHDNNEEVHNE